jgi:outer membrane lipoprotein-sorting protein
MARKKILITVILIALIAFTLGCTEKSQPAQSAKNRIATIETSKV